ncbi:MAG: hypothetical protein H0T92_05875 [Pyrinomonadaceae bacterium]|nr:hypothetical protein [Pyrinomonadaceae bacterium]
MLTRLVKEEEASKLSWAPYRLPFFSAGQSAVGAAAATEPSAAPQPAIQSTTQPAQLVTGGPHPEEALASIDDAASLAEVVIGEARLEASRLIAEARHQARGIERAAHEQALSESRARLAAECEEASHPLRERMAQSLADITNLHTTIVARAERDLGQLAMEIAKKIVHREVTVDREIALRLVRIALARLHTRTTASVHLHPDDYAYLRAYPERLGNGSVEIVEDRSVGRGGCLVRTEVGDFNATIEQQFAEIERGLLSF